MPGPVFAVLHRPARPETGAVVISPPFGWSEECAHRGIAVWARELAAAGFTTLRLDLPGTRNSGGGPSDRRPATWSRAISAAAAWLRDREGAERVTLLGIELGGLAGWAAAADGAPIDDLILWAVPGKGRSAVREVRMQAAVVAARHAGAEGEDDGRPDAAGHDGPEAERLETVGYVLEESALDELSALEPVELPLAQAARRRVLLLDRDAHPADARLAERLRDWGVDTTVAPGPGYSELMADPQFSRPPRDTIAATIAWLRRGLTPSVTPTAPSAPDPSAPDPSATGPSATAGRSATVAGPQASTAAGLLTAPAGPRADSARLRVAGGTIRETAVSLPGGSGSMFAIVSEPEGTPRAPMCAVLLNAGSVSHAGPNRAWVEICRRWAAAGVPTVRVDLPGIGESEGDADRFTDVNVYYERELTEQAIAVLDGLETLGLPSRFALAGLCSGAYWALHASLLDPRVCGAMLLNLWAFYFTPALVLERAPQDALARLRHGGVSRLIRGDFSRERLARAVRSINPASVVTGARRPIERSQSASIVEAVSRLDRRGVALTLLFGIGEPLQLQLERQGMTAELGRWPHLTIERIPSRDHMFRSLSLQRTVHAQLDDALQRALSRAVELEGRGQGQREAG